MLIELTRLLPKRREPRFKLNTDQIVWVQPNGEHWTVMPSNGPEIEIAGDSANIAQLIESR
jgi:hypothetical protein